MHVHVQTNSNAAQNRSNDAQNKFKRPQIMHNGMVLEREHMMLLFTDSSKNRKGKLLREARLILSDLVYIR